MHAEWCTWIKAGKTDDLDLCDCNPCNVCDGHGQYSDEDGNRTIDCIQCDNHENRTHRR
jgi:hypothetical protein